MNEYDSSALTLSLLFTRAQFIAIRSHLQRIHSATAGAQPTALYITERETTSIFQDLYCGLAARWTVHTKIACCGILTDVYNLCCNIVCAPPPPPPPPRSYMREDWVYFEFTSLRIERHGRHLGDVKLHQHSHFEFT